MSIETNTAQTNTPQTQVNWASLTATGLGAAKLFAEAFGMPFFTNAQVDAVVNVVAVGVVTFGILYNHFKKA